MFTKHYEWLSSFTSNTISYSLSAIPDFCGGVLLHRVHTLDPLYTISKEGAREFFLSCYKNSQDVNDGVWGESSYLPIIFYDRRGGIIWTIAKQAGLRPLNTWYNPTSTNTVGVFMYNYEEER